jgi:hypothetical protein
MSDEKAEALLENLLRLVSPGGYFVLNGNLDVKTRFAKKHGLVPITYRSHSLRGSYEDQMAGHGITPHPNLSKKTPRLADAVRTSVYEASSRFAPKNLPRA